TGRLIKKLLACAVTASSWLNVPWGYRLPTEADGVGRRGLGAAGGGAADSGIPLNIHGSCL
ncbi:MAG: hypothetical protein ACP5MH_08790, partial [Thermoproteus sp.]